MSKVESFVTRIENVEAQAWSDERGSLSFHTLISGETTPSRGLVAGVVIFEPGGELAPHSHVEPEIYFVLEGAAIVIIEGLARVVATGDAVFIPGEALHSVKNPFGGACKIFYVFPADRFDEIRYNFAR